MSELRIGNTYNHYTKISDEDVAFIREHYIPYSKDWSGAALGRMFGISRQQVNYIIKGMTRKITRDAAKDKSWDDIHKKNEIDIDVNLT